MTPEQIQELRELRAKVMADGERGGFNVGLQGMYQNRLSVAAPQLLSAAERCVVLEEQVASAREDLLRILPGSLNPHLMIGEAIRKLTPTNTKDNDTPENTTML